MRVRKSGCKHFLQPVAEKFDSGKLGRKTRHYVLGHKHGDACGCPGGAFWYESGFVEFLWSSKLVTQC